MTKRRTDIGTDRLFSGNIILDETVQLEALDRKVPINVNQLSRGNYFLKIISKKKQETIRFIKQ